MNTACNVNSAFINEFIDTFKMTGCLHVLVTVVNPHLMKITEMPSSFFCLIVTMALLYTYFFLFILATTALSGLTGVNYNE